MISGVNGLKKRPCHGSALEIRKGLLLGVSLAELAIKEAILVDPFKKPLLFQIGDDSDQLLDLKQLLSRVKESEQSTNFRNAVRSCLYFDSKELQGLRTINVAFFKTEVHDK